MNTKNKHDIVCSLIRIDDFDKNGNYTISQDVPLLEEHFDDIDSAKAYGENHLGTKMTFPRFWGVEYDNADLVEIIVGYKLYDSNSENHGDFLFKLCNSDTISELYKLYKKGGQNKMIWICLKYCVSLHCG